MVFLLASLFVPTVIFLKKEYLIQAVINVLQCVLNTYTAKLFHTKLRHLVLVIKARSF